MCDCNKWFSIETAPKDGTVILVWPYWNDDQPAAVCWRERKPGRVQSHWATAAAGLVAIGATPTHWMPLPPAPASPVAEEGER